MDGYTVSRRGRLETEIVDYPSEATRHAGFASKYRSLPDAYGYMTPQQR
jgi:hypothetical protein